MSQHIERRQCGCVNDCFGTDIKTREEELEGILPQQRACCEQCEDSEAPCVYEVLSACDHKIRYPDDDPGYYRIVMPKVLSLRKYCITGCEYRAGRGTGTSEFGLIPGSTFYFPIPAAQVTSYGADFANIRFPKLCTINEQYWYPEELDSLVPQLLREDYDKLIDFSTTWILREIADSGGLWELVYVAPDNVALDISYSISSVAEGVLDELAVKLGRAIRYVSTEPWKCLEANNLEIDEETRARYPTLPKFVCVRPKIDDVAHLCDTTESQCACCDNGMCTGYGQITIDCPGGPYQVPAFETKRYLPEERLDAVEEISSPGVSPFAECMTGQPPVPEEIEELVPDVDTVPCGIFYGTFSGGGIVWWCTGEDYNMILWCIDPITEEAVVIFNGPPTTFECRCDWYYFTINFETPPACLSCPGGGEPVVTECCPDDPLPRTLTISDGVVSKTLTYDEAFDYWRFDDLGGFSFAGCTLTGFYLQCVEGSFTEWALTLIDGNSPAPNAFPTSVVCDPLLLRFTTEVGGTCGAGGVVIEITL
jgi:hypothetical protein